MTTATSDNPHKRSFRPGLMLLLAMLVILISASVILADILSPHRPSSADTRPASQPAGVSP